MDTRRTVDFHAKLTKEHKERGGTGQQGRLRTDTVFRVVTTFLAATPRCLAFTADHLR